MWQHLINAILGLWIILSSFMGMSSSSMSVNLMIVGAVVAVLGFWGAYSDARADQRYEETENKHMRA